MRLDMYLYGASYTINGETLQGTLKLDVVAYWRKQNAIHKFFVDEVQDSIDNCAMYWVSIETLDKLKTRCENVLNNPSFENAMAVLPTQGGFFFGGTDLTNDFEMEYYLDGLKYTVEVLNELLDNNSYEYYYYNSSW